MSFCPASSRDARGGAPTRTPARFTRPTTVRGTGRANCYRTFPARLARGTGADMRVELGSAIFAALAAKVAAHKPATGYEWGVHTVDGVPFELLGEGVSRVSLLGPDGVVYKASKTPDYGQFTSERALFDSLAEQRASWCPDFWPYDALRVMAMRFYRMVSDLGSLTPDQLGFYHENLAWVGRVPVGVGNFALDANSRLVLIDGGYPDALSV
jgi:hypothetical protein